MVFNFVSKGFPGGSDDRRPGFDSSVGKIPCRRKWQSTPVLLLGKSHGQRSLVGYSPWGRKELDTTERLHFHFSYCSWVLKARILKWVALSLSRGFFWPKKKLASLHSLPLRHQGSPRIKDESESEVAQSRPTLCDPMDCSLPGSSIHGTFQAIVLEWIAISFSRGSSQPRDQTQVSHIVDRRFTVWATREVIIYIYVCVNIYTQYTQHTNFLLSV